MDPAKVAQMVNVLTDSPPVVPFACWLVACWRDALRTVMIQVVKTLLREKFACGALSRMRVPRHTGPFRQLPVQ